VSDLANGRISLRLELEVVLESGEEPRIPSSSDTYSQQDIPM